MALDIRRFIQRFVEEAPTTCPACEKELAHWSRAMLIANRSTTCSAQRIR